jgi:hypothetical protein
MEVGSLQIGSGTTASVLRAAEKNPEVASKLLKKSMDMDRDMVNTLLPAPPPSGGLDVQA